MGNMNISVTALMIIVVQLLLLGCTQNAPEPQIPSEPEQVRAPSEQTPEPAVVPVDEPTINTETQSFLDKIKGVKSYQYHDGLRQIRVFGGKAYVDIDKIKNYRGREYTAYYVDTVQKKAYLACNGEKKCTKHEDKTSYSEAPYNEFSIPEYPLDRMRFKNASLDMAKSQIIEGIRAYALLFTDRYGRKGIMLLHNYYAFPLSITYSDGVEVNYRKVVFNQVTEEEVTLPADLTSKPLIQASP